MAKEELLRTSRNLLLKLHKSMLDLEKELYEGIHGPQTPGQFLNLLLENEDFAWLRRFSTLIVEIDELLASREPLSSDIMDAHLKKVRELVEMSDADDYFRAKYQFSLQRDTNAVVLQSELKQVLSKF